MLGFFVYEEVNPDCVFFPPFLGENGGKNGKSEKEGKGIRKKERGVVKQVC